MKSKGYNNIIGKTHAELDLTNQQAVREYFEQEKPDIVVLAAAKVGGINANNTTPAEFAYENMQIQCNIIKCCHDFKVKKLLFLGSTCIYPKMAEQPIVEDALLSGPLEETNEAYAIAKISGLEMCKFFKRQYGDDFISCMPTNLYGPYDNYDLHGSHVMPAMIRKFHEAKEQDKPILLLDDVLSELDSNRQNFLLNSIGDIQTIVTCTGLDEFINNRININKVFKVTNGTVSHIMCGDEAAEMR